MDLDALLHILAGLIPAEYLGLVMAAVAICSALDALLPQPPAGSRWVPARRGVAWVALNLRHARNAVPAGVVPVAVATAAAAVQAGSAVLEQAAAASEAQRR